MATARVTSDGVHLPRECTEVVDVLFDDQRVLTLTPTRHAPVDGLRLAPWPVRLRPMLTGTTAVRVREHVSGRVWFDDAHSFDDAPMRTEVKDEQGYPLAVDKWGFLVRTFDSSDPSLGNALLDDLDALLRLLGDELGVPAFLAYGTLLGAVRSGRFIGHDNDADISYVSAHEHPADVVAESYRIERGLLDAGWRVHRSTGGFLQVWYDADADAQRKIDVFTGYFRGEVFAVERWVRAPLDRASLLPLGTVTLEGRPFPAPARPEDLLAATYGPGWRVPDPSFKFVTPPAAERRSTGWFGEFWRHQWLWAGQAHDAPRTTPSEFARWVAGQLDDATTVTDLGCGTGADAVLLAAAGHRVAGLDYAEEAVDRARAAAGGAGVEAEFEVVSFEDLRATLLAAARIGSGSRGTGAACSRNLLNALSPTGRDHLWRACEVLLGGGGCLFLEYVDAHDEAGRDQAPEPPARHGPDPATVRAELEARHATVVSCEHTEAEGRRVCRIVARWGA